jgi:hypothetical protein
MFSNWRRWLLSGERHATDEDLLLFLDNEATGWRAARIRRHLDLCWTCRVRKENLQQAIHDYVAVRSQAAATGGEGSARLRMEFDRRLAAQEKPPAAGLRRLRFRMPAAAWACLAIAAVAFGATRSAPVRAMLGRVFSAATAWASKPEPVTLRPAVPPVAPHATATKEEAHHSAVPVDVTPVPSALPARTIARREIENAKIEVLYSLHRTGACLRYPLEVAARTTDGLQVRGVLENAEQRERVVATGRGREWVHFNISTAAEAIEQQRERSAAASPVAAPAEGEVVRGSAPAVQPLLVRYFRARAQLEDVGPMIVRFSNGSLDRAAALKEHAWALRRLAEDFPERTAYDSMDQAHAWLLEEMVADHMNAVRGNIASLQQTLSEVFPAVSGQAAAELRETERPRSWQDAVSLTFVTAETIERATRRCFASTGGDQPDAESAAAELARSFAPAVARINVLQALVERGFDIHHALQRKPAPVSGAPDSPKRQMQ